MTEVKFKSKLEQFQSQNLSKEVQKEVKGGEDIVIIDDTVIS